MSHFSDIGFQLKNEDELYALAEQVYPQAKAFPCEKGTYYQYTDPSGAELWLQINSDRELIGINPHFSGKSQFPVGVHTEVERSSSELDAALHCWMAPHDPQHLESGHYPIVLDIPDYYVKDTQTYPALGYFQIAAFAEEMEVFENEEAYYESQGGDAFRMSAQSFIPAGLFGGEGKEDFVPAAIANFSGKVVHAETRTNAFSQKAFHYLQVATFGGTYDVVADTQLWPTLPPIDGIVSGQFWLSARQTASPLPEEAPAFRKRRLKKVFTNLFSKLS